MDAFNEFSIILLYVIPQLTQNQDFVKNIIKEECINETNQIGYFCGFSYKINEQNDTMTTNFSFPIDNPYEQSVTVTHINKITDTSTTWKEYPRIKEGLLIAKTKCDEIIQQAYINSMNLEYPDTLKTWNNPLYEIKQICNNVLVDEIEYEDPNFNEVGVPDRYKTFTCPNYYSCKCNYEGEISEPCFSFCKDNLCYIKTIKISKKGITKEWLDTNCICNSIHATKEKRKFDKKYGLTEYNRGGYDEENANIFIVKDISSDECGDRIHESNNLVNGCAESSIWECSKYKCENYEVEVK
jgi:hypothetical protein